MLKRILGLGRAQARTVSIESTGLSFPVGPGETVLEAALRAGIAFPNKCRSGACGTCRCTLREGRVREKVDTSYVLGADDLQRGQILACQSLACTDLRLAVEGLQPQQRIPAPRATEGEIIAMRPLTADILEIRLRLQSPMPYLAGQYAELARKGIPGARQYSFARGSGDGHAVSEPCFFVRHVPGGRFTAWLHHQAVVGDCLSVQGPYGDFWLRDAMRPMLCVAGGSGMAPLRAMLEDAAERQVERDVLFCFGARTEADLYCLDDMKLLASRWRGRFRFLPVLSEEPAESDWQGRRGMVTAEMMSELKDPAGMDAYLCGPPPMVDDGIARLKAAGMAEARIRFDRFLDASHQPSAQAVP
ncbi:MAG: 2Fe-2S iron-sulfur cluster binding domain-containing protein [Ectothiorhodospiraceae bacterium]|nr:2Fe-2S iron-sulfur cluster binding domain-containing protein [Ectothiorhodospiraceae bacterium]MCH8503008.1 2Fe-2S iron-sulfur cluster binding domain-containing protein [Ectothiorhodospiraceae bacterium]